MQTTQPSNVLKRDWNTILDHFFFKKSQFLKDFKIV